MPRCKDCGLQEALSTEVVAVRQPCGKRLTPSDDPRMMFPMVTQAMHRKVMLLRCAAAGAKRRAS